MPSYEKSIPYECGELPEGTPWIRFNPRYYVFALIFIIFDVEIAFMYPCAVLFRDWIDQGLGKIAFYEISAFAAILMLGLVYAWKRGDLQWIRSQQSAAQGAKNASVAESQDSRRAVG
jgi:NADH-quinone oxidoreductase subunit A